MIQEYTFRQQYGNRGLYASISFEIIRDSTQPPGSIFTYEGDLRWKAACEAGVLIFFDYFSRSNPGWLSVSVTNVKWLPVDSNNLTVIFAVVKGLCEALNVHLDNLAFDPANGTFNFPDCRT
jgi:hypothetical protein